jgi:hypothetical protein
MILFLLVGVLLCLVPHGELLAAEPVPNAMLDVTVRQKEEGKLGKGLHLFQVRCWDGECSLSALSLNQCGRAGSGKPVFAPAIERTSTREGNLRVSNSGNVLELQQELSDVGGRSTATLRIGYAIGGSTAIADRVTSFSGGFVKRSAIVERMIAVEYVPLMGEFQEVRLDCAVLLPGVRALK